MGKVEEWRHTTEFKMTSKDASTYVSLDGGTDTLKNVYPKRKEKKNLRLEEAQDIPTT